MWLCPKCGREFKRNNQPHYCGEAPQTIEEYIALQVPEIRPYLSSPHGIIGSALPDAKQRIAWSMPTYGVPTIVQFAACKNHVSLYVGKEAIAQFASELVGLACKKAAIYLKYKQPLPEKLITGIVRWCGKENF